MQLDVTKVLLAPVDLTTISLLRTEYEEQYLSLREAKL